MYYGFDSLMKCFYGLVVMVAVALAALPVTAYLAYHSGQQNLVVELDKRGVNMEEYGWLYDERDEEFYRKKEGE